MPDVPEHLLRRSRERREALGGDAGADAPSDATAEAPAEPAAEAPAAAAAQSVRRHRTHPANPLNQTLHPNPQSENSHPNH